MAVRRSGPIAYITIIIAVAVAIGAGVVIANDMTSAPSVDPTQWVRYLGVYEPDAPFSYAGVDQFAQAIGKQPNIATYYSQWLEPFQVGFAASAAKRGAVTLVQIAPRNISVASIASGRYDSYLRSFAAAVNAFAAPVVLSFGHEMNGYWYSWGYTHTSSAVFVAAWRHVVTVFREQGTRNVTWLWTVNIIDTLDNRIPGPKPWWPGKSYVNWVGIDGYYYSASWNFTSLFGPTITDVRQLTGDPILISETGAPSSAGQPAKIADLFAGVRLYGLLGFVWFDKNGGTILQQWRIDSTAAKAQFNRDTKAFFRP